MKVKPILANLSLLFMDVVQQTDPVLISDTLQLNGQSKCELHWNIMSPLIKISQS